MDYKRFKVGTNESVKVKDFQTSIISDEEDQKVEDDLYNEEVPKLRKLHHQFFAEAKHGAVIILQAMDAAGKDEVIQYLFSNILPQGLQVKSFGQPEGVEAAHDYLWRYYQGIPERGVLGILNRSYYEDIIAPQVHQSLEEANLPDSVKHDKELIHKRYKHVNHFEQYLVENGYAVVKFFFNMSKERQKERLLNRMKQADHQWEFSFSDLEDRKKWDLHHQVFSDMIENTSSKEAPWYILPADNPWLSRKIVSEVLIDTFQRMGVKFPEFKGEDQDKLEEAIHALEQE